MTFWLVLLAAFLMWTMWICSFMHQMYPLARPTVGVPFTPLAFKVKCFDDAMCLHVSKEICDNQLYDYHWVPVGNGTCEPGAI
jgi:hypothetical protein